MSLTFITSNDEKFRIAELILQDKGIPLSRQSLSLNELQSNDLLEIASYSASEAFRLLQTGAAVTDVGFYITALNGFPGPFVKYMNQYLSPENIISLMSGITNREIIVKECLVIASGPSHRRVYWTEFHGRIAEEPSRRSGTSFERILIPDGFEAPISEYSAEEQFAYWKKGSTWNAVRPGEWD